MGSRPSRAIVRAKRTFGEATRPRSMSFAASRSETEVVAASIPTHASRHVPSLGPNHCAGTAAANCRQNPSRAFGVVSTSPRYSSAVSPCSRRSSPNIRSPSGALGFPSWPMSLDTTQLSTPTPRIAS